MVESASLTTGVLATAVLVLLTCCIYLRSRQRSAHARQLDFEAARNNKLSDLEAGAATPRAGDSSGSSTSRDADSSNACRDAYATRTASSRCIATSTASSRSAAASTARRFRQRGLGSGRAAGVTARQASRAAGARPESRFASEYKPHPQVQHRQDHEEPDAEAVRS